MINTWPSVTRRNRFQSSEIRQGISGPLPITPLRANAAIATIDPATGPSGRLGCAGLAATVIRRSEP
jgi:hypothetical protein